MLYGNIIKPTDSNGITPIAVNGTATVYSKAFKLSFGQSFGVWYKAASSGTIALKIQLEQGSASPTTEGSSDANYVIGNGVADIDSNLSNNTVNVKTFSPVPMLWARLKITGLAGNDSTTTLDLRAFIQEMAGC